ncbi:hypothetical protein LTSEUGA_2960 [Salmonella enterica subsp. enterica serovar Uganda str. R8-3404]|uniref:Uncharacterized protein n=1 Tax=Salmonella enterica subsp. enterica serovar Uganda str. R8-3404 TaxID=913083 RepID=A0A6C8H114_SALET|nr:hypothetical protein LTSEUGA_2960 [Salmonella enterica subsp. enterica serovar Uganda str. R8-3404]
MNGANINEVNRVNGANINEVPLACQSLFSQKKFVCCFIPHFG